MLNCLQKMLVPDEETDVGRIDEEKPVLRVVDYVTISSGNNRGLIVCAIPPDPDMAEQL